LPRCSTFTSTTGAGGVAGGAAGAAASDTLRRITARDSSEFAHALLNFRTGTITGSGSTGVFAGSGGGLFV